jgi:serine/threonine protein kinase/tetratricopeptide (TPR) repeat protein
MTSDEITFSGTQRFEVKRRLGQGGMGSVYHAFDRLRGTDVAIKTMGRVVGEPLRRFKEEFRVLQELHHENLVNLGELFEEEGLWFFTMELLDGVDLLEWVRPNVRAPDVVSEGPTLPAGALGGRRYDPVSPTQTAPQVLPLLEEASSPVEGGRSPRALVAGSFDEGRLREAIAQLAEGVDALHRHERLHLDIKPLNVIVAGGRVVLIDFGLSAKIHDDGGVAALPIMGTAHFMAPEQVLGEGVGPPADWYAVGATLYLALTGVPPIDDGDVPRLLARKLREEPLPPFERDPRVPRDLSDLAVELLRIVPEARPSGEVVLRRLRGVSGPSRRRAPSPTATFVGRADELAALQRSLERCREGEQVVALVTGPSGIGKSTLVDRFVGGSRPDLVLRGRCYEQEAVPFKAFQDVMDQLARTLGRLEPAALGALLPAHAGLLGLAFPVLKGIRALDQGVLPDNRDPVELRSLLFEALRELFTRLAKTHTLLVVIDDAQWADDESRQLFQALTRQPRPPPMLLLLTERLTTESAPSTMLAWLPQATEIPVRPLSPGEARAFAEAQLGERAAELSSRLDALIAHAQGHPIFLEALARIEESDGSGAEGESWAADLSTVVEKQLASLTPEARALLSLVCVAGTPIDRSLAASAASVSAQELPQRLRELRVARLLRAADARHPGAIEPYHARIAAAVLERLQAPARRHHHDAIARALERAGASPEEIARHWEGAGELERAARALREAATRSLTAFAFERAADFYRRALALGVLSADVASNTAVALGHALANAGRCEEAAAAYRQALPGAPASDRPDLLRRVAEQLLTAGMVREGFAAGRDALAVFGLGLPGSSPPRSCSSASCACASPSEGSPSSLGPPP